MKVLIEEICAHLTEVFGAVVVFTAVGALIAFCRNFGDMFILHFLG